jgi:hypothetical protein
LARAAAELLQGPTVVTGDEGPSDEVQSLAAEIARYLERRAGGADTLEGITHWWIRMQRLAEAEEKVRRAVEHLCERGVLERRVLPGGRVVYRAAGTPREGK